MQGKFWSHKISLGKEFVIDKLSKRQTASTSSSDTTLFIRAINDHIEVPSDQLRLMNGDTNLSEVSLEIATLLRLGTTIHSGKKDPQFAIIIVNPSVNKLDVIN